MDFNATEISTPKHLKGDDYFLLNFTRNYNNIFKLTVPDTIRKLEER